MESSRSSILDKETLEEKPRTGKDLTQPEYLEMIVQTPADTAKLPEGDSIDVPPEDGVSSWKVKCPHVKHGLKFIICLVESDGTIRRLRLKHIDKQGIRKARFQLRQHLIQEVRESLDNKEPNEDG